MCVYSSVFCIDVVIGGRRVFFKNNFNLGPFPPEFCTINIWNVSSQKIFTCKCTNTDRRHN